MKTLIVAGALAVALGVSSTAAAQYPAKPVRIIMGLPAGTTADTVARIVAQPLSQVPAFLEQQLADWGKAAREAELKPE